jgi:hypothetical protein
MAVIWSPAAQQGRALLDREGELRFAHLDQLAAGPHPVQPKRRIDPRGDDHLQVLGAGLQQPAQHLDSGMAGEVEVIDDRDQPGVQPLHVLGQRGDDVGGCRALRGQQLQGIVAEPRFAAAASERFEQGSHEARRIRVSRVAAEPRRHPTRVRR